jgi:hypothetical protein
MVNKQYNIHNPKSSVPAGGVNKKQYSPTPTRNDPEISTLPNPSSVSSSLSLASLLPHMMGSKGENLDTITEETEKQQTVFGRNIKYFNEDTIDYGSEGQGKEPTHHGHSASRDDLTTIGGLNRFQYILQMDKEMKVSACFLFLAKRKPTT